MCVPGCEAINTLGIIPRYGGLIVHDCWKAYLTYTQCKHQLCGAHLLRELQAVTDSNAYPWARKMHKLLLIARRQVIQRPQQRLSMRHYKRIARCYKAILEQGRSEMPQIPPRKKGQRGPVAKSDAHNLHERLVVQRKNVLRFTRRADTLTTGPSAISAWPRSSRRSGLYLSHKSVRDFSDYFWSSEARFVTLLRLCRRVRAARGARAGVAVVGWERKTVQNGQL